VILMLDNYDSFTYNIVQYFAMLGAEPVVYRNDEISASDALAMQPRAILLSPGPGRPENAGVMNELVKLATSKVPILGICLGHQALAQVFGGRITYAPAPVHGKTSEIHHDGSTLFAGLDCPFQATRYHSLTVDASSLPSGFRTTAWTDDGVIMGLEHQSLRLYGVQFHPESIMTPCGKEIFRNFLETL